MATSESLSTESFEDEDADDYWPLWVQVILSITIFIIFAVNIIGNITTLVAFFKDKALHTCHNYYICNLAVTDLVIGLSSLPFYAVYTVANYYWPFSYVFCKIWCVVDFWVCAESSLTIILISYDRLTMVTQGALYQTKQTKKKTLVTIAVSWLLSFLLYGPAIIGYDYWRGHSTVEEDDCDVEFATDFWYTLITAIIEFCIPFVLLTVLNCLLFWYIIKQQRKLKVQQKTIAGGNTSDVIRKQNATLKKNKKIASSLFILVLMYAVCWTPYTVSVIVMTLCDDCVNKDLFEFFNWLLWMNSSLNPLIYALTNERFRMHYKKMLCPCMKTKITPVQVPKTKSTGM